MEDEGLATSEWIQVHQNVKLYRLLADRITIEVGPRGIEVALEQTSRAPAESPHLHGNLHDPHQEGLDPTEGSEIPERA